MTACAENCARRTHCENAACAARQPQTRAGSASAVTRNRREPEPGPAKHNRTNYFGAGRIPPMPTPAITTETRGIRPEDGTEPAAPPPDERAVSETGDYWRTVDLKPRNLFAN